MRMDDDIVLLAEVVVLLTKVFMPFVRVFVPTLEKTVISFLCLSCLYTRPRITMRPNS
jgi:hypothetical protein